MTSHHPQPPTRLLIVDDNDGVRQLLRLMFGDDARIKIVGEAQNGAEAVRQAEKLEPDVVIIDTNMPIMDGFTALPYLREKVPEATLIVWTATEVDENAEERAYAAGADAFFMKAGQDPTGIIDRVLATRAARG